MMTNTGNGLGIYSASSGRPSSPPLDSFSRSRHLVVIVGPASGLGGKQPASQALTCPTAPVCQRGSCCRRNGVDRRRYPTAPGQLLPRGSRRFPEELWRQQARHPPCGKRAHHPAAFQRRGETSNSSPVPRHLLQHQCRAGQARCC